MIEYTWIKNLPDIIIGGEKLLSIIQLKLSIKELHLN